MRTVEIPVPYDQGDMALELTLDPSSGGKTMDGGMEWLNDHVSWSDEEAMERLFRTTVILFHAQAGTLGECLDTALIWERG